MSIQEISVSNNQRKKLSHIIDDQNIVQTDENGDVIINVDAYRAYKKLSKKTPVEDILDDVSLDFNSEYFFFS